MWKITCYNGEVWETEITMTICEVVKKFKSDTGYHELDIKTLVNLI